jgi:carboxypeptidase Taq
MPYCQKSADIEQSIMSAQIFAAARKSMLDQIGSGDFSTLLQWLRTNIHNKASLLEVNDILTEATGEALNENYFIEHLKARYG